MEDYFCTFRSQIIGIDQHITTPFHDDIPLVYADWTAGGRMYACIENIFQEHIYPLVANTHTDTSYTGTAMTHAYHRAQRIVKQHVNASEEDVIIACGSGMTGAVNKLQRILGFKIHERFSKYIDLPPSEVPVVFVTHMEHHSNQTSWYETIADVVVVPPGEDGLVSLDNFEACLAAYSDRSTKIAAITSCSNVTGLFTPYMDIAERMHAHGGLCFVDFACSAPYIDIDMHESDEAGRYLDAIYFSPHKFLGGPGSSGIVIFNKNMYHNSVPDHPGGGTVDWTNPWGGHKYIDSIEAREDGGTPPFLQTMRVALCCQLKEQMGTQQMHLREKEMVELVWSRLTGIPNLHILAEEHRHRLAVISLYIDGLHYNLGVRMLNDRFGIQSRGGCSCAGTYGHILLNVDEVRSKKITDRISSGDCSMKPGWIRISFHPTNTNAEINYVCDAIIEMAEKHRKWKQDYSFDLRTGEISAKENDRIEKMQEMMDACFEPTLLLGEPVIGNPHPIPL